MNKIVSPNDIFAIYPLASVFSLKFHYQVSHKKKLGISDHENEKIDDNSSVTDDVSNASNIENLGDDYEK
jgi:hypothetical protein